jgi:RNA polymerase sigma-70 factor (ECF subfamily)
MAAVCGQRPAQSFTVDAAASPAVNMSDVTPLGSEQPVADMPEAILTHRPQLVRFLWRKLGCRATAEDVTQEVLERAYKASRESPVRHPKAFLYRIAANLMVNHVVADRRRQAVMQRAQEYLLAGVNPEAHSPEKEVGDSQELALLESRVTELPERTRRILYLNRCEGLSQSQIARLLGISKTAVEKHMRRAMAHLASARWG